jgi:hypothetical protein
MYVLGLQERNPASTYIHVEVVFGFGLQGWDAGQKTCRAWSVRHARWMHAKQLVNAMLFAFTTSGNLPRTTTNSRGLVEHASPPSTVLTWRREETCVEEFCF